MSTPAGSSIARQHARVTTPTATLAALVRDAAGSSIDAVERIVEGYDNEVYRIRCADGRDVVIRILRFGRFDRESRRSATEARAIEAARARGVPAPEILLHDTVVIDGQPFPVMVQRAVPGQPLDEVLPKLTDRERDAVLTEIGELTARINAVPAEHPQDWTTAMAEQLEGRRSQRAEILGAGFPPARFDRIMDLLAEYARDFPCERWVLCHGDLSPRHIFVTGDGADEGPVRVSGIIDFSDAKPGTPVHDLAILRVRGPHLPLPPILAGRRAPTDPRYRRRLDLHTLDAAVSSLWIGAHEHDRACVDRSTDQISALLADLDGSDGSDG